MSYSALVNLHPKWLRDQAIIFDMDQGPDRSIGYDIDKKGVSIDGKLQGDYDEMIHAHVSGSGATIILEIKIQVCMNILRV